MIQWNTKYKRAFSSSNVEAFNRDSYLHKRIQEAHAHVILVELRCGISKNSSIILVSLQS